MSLTNDLLLLLIEIVVKTHDYEDLDEFKNQIKNIKLRIDARMDEE